MSSLKAPPSIAAKWSDSLIRAEFLKIYFSSFGVKDTLTIRRLTDLLNPAGQGSEEKLLFAIVEINDKTKNFRDAEALEKKEMVTSSLLETTDIKIMFPKNGKEKFHSSVNFMELAFSGFLTQKIPFFYHDNSPILNLFDKIEAQSKNGKLTFDELDKIFKNDTEILDNHNKIIKEVFGDEMKKIRLANEKKNYSLFFSIEGQLIEYVSSKNFMRIIQSEGVTESNITEKIVEHIVRSNQERDVDDDINQEPSYYDNVVLFLENKENQKQDTISSNVGELLLILLNSILFIVNFMIANPQSLFFEKSTNLDTLLDPSWIKEVTDIKHFHQDIFNDHLNEFNLDNVMVFSGMLLEAKNMKDNDIKARYFGIEPKTQSTPNYSYIDPDVNKGEKKYFDNLAFDNSLSEFDSTLMFYSSDYDIVSIKKIKFSFDSMRKITIKKKYDSYRVFLNKKKVSITLLVINIFYLLTLVYDTYRIVNLFTNRTIDYFKYKVNSFEIVDFVELITFILVLSSQIWFYSRFLWTGRNFKIILPTEEQFRDWVDFGVEARRYKQFTSFCLLFIFFKLIKFFYNSFPALGIVLETFSVALPELCSLFSLVFVVILLLVFMFHSHLGLFSASYFQFGNAFLSLYLLFLGIFDYDRDFEYYGHSNYLTPYLWCTFFVVFQLVLCNVFLCLVRSTYRDVKEKKERINDAIFQMTKDSAFSTYIKIKNLITFKDPESEKNKNEKVKLSSANQNPQTVQTAGEGDTEVVSKALKKNWYKIFKYNFANLGVGSLFKKNILDLEEFEQKKQECFLKIRKEIINNYIKELKVNTSADFNLFFDAILFIIYTVMICVMVYVQLDLSKNEHVQIFGKNVIEKNFFYEIEGYDQSNFPEFVLNNFKYEMSFQENLINIDSDLALLSSALFRTTTRLYKKKKTNYNAIKEEHFEEYFENGDAFLTTEKCPYSYEETQPITEQTPQRYTEKGNGYSSLDDCGGYVNIIGWNLTEASFENEITNLQGRVNSLINNNNYKIGSIYLDFFLFNKNYDYLIYVVSYILKNPSGHIKNGVDINMIPFNRFVTNNDFIRIVIEIIYYIFFLYFCLKCFWSILMILYGKIIRNYESSNNSEEFKDSLLINKYYRFSLQAYKNDKGCWLITKLIFYSLFIFIYKTILLVYLLIISIFEFIFSSFFNFVDLLSIGISIGMIALWFYIIHITNGIFVGEITFENEGSIEESLNNNNNLFKVNHLNVLYRNYRSWQAANLFLIFVRLIRYLKFSKSISLVFKIFQKAKLTISLYLIFLLIVDIGFVFFGYGLFFEHKDTFKTLGTGILSLLIILAGKVHPNDIMYLEDDVWTPIYFFLFTTFNILVLLNFFYSILIEGYFEMKERQVKNLGKNSDSNFFSNVYFCLVGKRKTFLEVCERYQKKIQLYFDTYISNVELYNKELKSIVEDKNKTEANDGHNGNQNKKKRKCSLFRNMSLTIEIIRGFYEDIAEISKKCMNINDFNASKPQEKNSSEVLIDQEEESFQQDKKEDILSSIYGTVIEDEVSIYHKIMIYIANYFKYDDLYFISTVPFSKTTMVTFKEGNNEEAKSGKKVEKEQKSNNKWENNFYTEYKKTLYNQGAGFLKANIFDKYHYYLNKNVSPNIYYLNQIYYSDPKLFNEERIPRFSKETHLEQNELMRKNDFFETPSVLAKLKKNRTNTIPCESNCYKEGKLCEECLKINENYKKLSYDIYDNVIKYFYIPNFNKLDDKDLYLGYYIYEIKKSSKNSKYSGNITQNLSKDVPKNKIDGFTRVIMSLIEEIPNDFLPASCIEVEDNEKKKKKKKINTKRKQEELYYYFFIWNIVYMILFNKNPQKVRMIRNGSKSYAIVGEYKASEKKKETLFSYLFTRLYDLNSATLDKDDLKNYSLPNGYNFCKALRLIIRNENLVNSIEISVDNFDKNSLFFFQNEKTLLEEDENLENLIVNESPNKNSIDNALLFDYYPKIFKEMWNKIEKEDLFHLFYGYNPTLSSNHKINIFGEILKENFVSRYLDKLDVYEYFLPEHKAEIISMLSPGKIFLDIAKNKLLEKYDEKAEEYSTIKKIQNFGDLLNYFSENRINLSFKNELYTELFEICFKDIKSILRKRHEENSYLYHKFLRYNNDNLGVVEKIAFARFFTLVLDQERFQIITKEISRSAMNKPLKMKVNYDEEKNNINILNDNIYADVDGIQTINLGEEEEEAAKKDLNIQKKAQELKRNPFVWMLSLDQYEYIDVCEKIKNDELRLFYLTLYRYVYRFIDTKEDYYIKRKIKLNFIEKYQKYLEYVSKREKIEKQRSLCQEKETDLNDALKYLSKRQEEYDKLYANWNKQRIGLGQKIKGDI